MAEMTPMMRQYQELKAKHPDCVLFFRLGDFYEMFNEDARVAAKELDLTLTTRDRKKEKEEQVPMCGVPYHSVEAYIARMVQKGYKVAISEQLEDPALVKGLVRRDITRIVTPGSVVDTHMLDESKNNYFACVFGENGRYGLSFCDISTGAFYATFVEGADAMERVISELGQYSPSEVLRGGDAAKDEVLTQALKDRLDCCADVGSKDLFQIFTTDTQVTEHFGKSLRALGIKEYPEVWRSAGALLRTLKELQKSDLSHVGQMEFYIHGRYLELDLTARRNLELTETLRKGEKKGSLLWVMDHTRTPMGTRMLRSWMERPLMNPKAIQRRLDAVEELTKNTLLRQTLLEQFRGISDLERLMARVSTGLANAKDLLNLRNGLEPLPALRETVDSLQAPYFRSLMELFHDTTEPCRFIDMTVAEDAPYTIKEGGIIKAGYDEKLDELRDIVSGGKDILAKIEAEEKAKTGIRNLKVGYNRVFGYYIEVAKGQVDLVPDTYIRKQTLTNAERFITPELKELESTILTAKERIVAMEYDHFIEIRNTVANYTSRILDTAKAIALMDVICCFAENAVKFNYCKPEIDLSGDVYIKEGRHPVVEQTQMMPPFVPNDTLLDTNCNRTLILTGPNMAGKSTYMRQVALMVLMAQMGSFVPAQEARFGIVDKIFTRIGASDELSSGKSTFMVEMSEMASILRHASTHSLLLLDEIGRGTSTFDGMAIARAVLEYATDKKQLGAKTLFATHYHELTDLEQEVEGVKNYHIAVKKRGGSISFLRKMVPGVAEGSFGIDVGKLAGLPEKVLQRSTQLLVELEKNGPSRTVVIPPTDQLSITHLENDALRKKLETMVLDTMSPLEALSALYELKRML